MSPSIPDPRSDLNADEAIDFKYVAHAVWVRRWAILWAMVAGLGLGVIASVANTKLVAQGLLLVPGMEIDDFKRYQTAFLNKLQFDEFLRLSGEKPSDAVERLEKIIREPQEIADAVKPEFAYTDRDAKQYSVQFEGAGSLVGISFRIRREALDSPNPVVLASEYFRHVMISVDLQEELFALCAAYQTRELELKSEVLETQFAIDAHNQKIALLQDLIAKNPSAAGMDSRQVVSITEGGERFLAPLAQLVGEESAKASLTVKQTEREREVTRAGLRRAYYCSARDSTNKSMLGRNLLDELIVVRKTVFDGRDMADPVNQVALNEFTIQRDRWLEKYLVQARFVAPPEGATLRVRSPGLAVGGLLGFLLAAVASIIFAIGRSWWRENQADIERPE